MIISNLRAKREYLRVPMRRSLPVYFGNCTLPCPDLNDPASLAYGVRNRLDRATPINPPDFLENLSQTTTRFIRDRAISPISPLSDRGFEAWISRTTYNDARRDELRKLNEDVVNMLQRNDEGELVHFRVKLFAKDENYLGFKHFRGIYAREDVAKIFFGPYFKLMEDEIYKCPEFIKHVPVAERPNYISTFLDYPGAQYLTTDYSSFECHFTEPVMRHCEFVLYEHMLKGLPEGKYVLDIMKEVIMGVNKIGAKHFGAEVTAMRMSGEMNTSLGNGFSNLMFMQNYCNETHQQLKGVVEGDDGLFAFYGPQDFSKLTNYGLILKMERHAELSTASFCGMIFDIDDKQSICDPFKTCAKMGWGPRRYARSGGRKLSTLLRAKALSAIHQYPSCPIVTAFALVCLRATEGISKYSMRKMIMNSKEYSIYEKKTLLDAINSGSVAKPITMKTRLLFEEVYDVSIETQYKIERALNDTTEYGMIVNSDFEDHFPVYARVCWDTFVSDRKEWEKHYPGGKLIRDQDLM